jgi:hypothetical protein
MNLKGCNDFCQRPPMLLRLNILAGTGLAFVLSAALAELSPQITSEIFLGTLLGIPLCIYLHELGHCVGALIIECELPMIAGGVFVLLVILAPLTAVGTLLNLHLYGTMAFWQLFGHYYEGFCGAIFAAALCGLAGLILCKVGLWSFLFDLLIAPFIGIADTFREKTFELSIIEKEHREDTLQDRLVNSFVVLTGPASGLIAIPIYLEYRGLNASLTCGICMSFATMNAVSLIWGD